MTAHAKTLKAIASAAEALENGANGEAMAAYLRVVLTKAYDTDNASWQQSFDAE